jgi:hypothetical protein
LDSKDHGFVKLDRVHGSKGKTGHGWSCKGVPEIQMVFGNNGGSATKDTYLANEQMGLRRKSKRWLKLRHPQLRTVKQMCRGERSRGKG